MRLKQVAGNPRHAARSSSRFSRRHGVLFILAPLTSLSLVGQEHGQTIEAWIACPKHTRRSPPQLPPSVGGIAAADCERVANYETCTGAAEPEDGGNNLVWSLKSSFKISFIASGSFASMPATIGVSMFPGQRAFDS